MYADRLFFFSSFAVSSTDLNASGCLILVWRHSSVRWKRFMCETEPVGRPR